MQLLRDPCQLRCAWDGHGRTKGVTTLDVAVLSRLPAWKTASLECDWPQIRNTSAGSTAKPQKPWLTKSDRPAGRPWQVHEVRRLPFSPARLTDLRRRRLRSPGPSRRPGSSASDIPRAVHTRFLTAVLPSYIHTWMLISGSAEAVSRASRQVILPLTHPGVG